MTETQERFLRTVLTRVPVDSVVELHLFPAIRRGTVETGVAVIATRLPPEPLTVVVQPEDAGELGTEEVVVEESAVEPAGFDAWTSDSPYADEPGDDEPDADDVRSAGELDGHGDIAEPADEIRSTPPAPRLRILTASYRATLKGIERGKWVVEVQEEAHAPLDAVEAVLRGVRHRSEEPADPELVSTDALAHLVAPGAVAPAA